MQDEPSDARSCRRAGADARGGKANAARLNVRRAAQVELDELASVTSPAPAPRERFSDVLERLLLKTGIDDYPAWWAEVGQ